MSQLYDISRSKNYGLYKKSLERNLAQLLNCEVEVYDNPIERMKTTYNIDLLVSKDKNVYYVDEKIILISKVKTKEEDNHKEKIIAYIGIELRQVLYDNRRILNRIAVAITKVMSEEYSMQFKNLALMLGQNLIYEIIHMTFFKKYDRVKMIHLINTFEKLKEKTFEGNHFSTGLIIKKKIGDEKTGENKRLKQTKDLDLNLISNTDLDKRIWYLVDGEHSFYVSDRDLSIKNIFIRNNSPIKVKDFLNYYTLKNDITGNDRVFRIINANQYSIIDTDAIEFINIGGRWKLRDYNFLIDILCGKIKNTNIEDKQDLIKSLIYYMLYCSHNGISTIIWLPDLISIKNNSSKINENFKIKNRILEQSLDIKNFNHSSSVIRCLSSDGVTIINNEGKLKYFGCIVNFESISIEGVKGTGESAAQVLGSRGVCIKVSQDGDIKIFFDGNERALLF